MTHTNSTTEGPNPSGFCMCGCGERTPIAPRTSVKRGLVKGTPYRYIAGHQHAGRSKELIGKRFGRWIVLRRLSDQDASGHSYFECRCDCGTHRDVSRKHLVGGGSRSCGCLQRELVGPRSKTHGMEGTREYRSWQSMKQRCYKQSHISYPDYGGRGIYVCERWRDSFEAFYEDMGPRPEGMTLDRVDVNGPYSPENCRWATVKEQNRNTRYTHLLTHNGETMSFAAWAERLGCNTSTLGSRLKAGWTIERALTTPVKFKRAHLSPSTSD